MLRERTDREVNDLIQKRDRIISRMKGVREGKPGKGGKMEWVTEPVIDSLNKERRKTTEEINKVRKERTEFMRTIENEKLTKEEIASALSEGNKEKDEEK